jgi:hypothetical protein
MNILENDLDLLEPVNTRYEDGWIFVQVSDGREVKFPCSENEFLSKASEKERAVMEISPCGIHWPLLNEDLSLKGIIEGRFGRSFKK